MTEDQIKHMVGRFLSWRLPKPWRPDNGISYARPNYAHAPAEHDWPTGTNLFDADQATAMVRYMVEGMTDPNHAAPPADNAELVKRLRENADDMRRWAANEDYPTKAAHIESIATLLDEAADARSRPAAPGMTDLMVSPESIDAFMEANPLSAAPVAEEVEKIIADRADWLVDAVATATQDRTFLRGEPEENPVATEAILENGKKAIRVALDRVCRLASAPRSPGKSAREIARDITRTWQATPGASLIELIAAALEAGQPKAEAWQPIETAPRDGKHVLVAQAGKAERGGPLRAFYRDGKWWPHLAGPSSREPQELTGTHEPTHWMPLPSAPASEVGGG